MWKLYNLFFGWDYVSWQTSAKDKGVARIERGENGEIFYWRYKSTRVAEKIVIEQDVIWLTCSASKYLNREGKE